MAPRLADNNTLVICYICVWLKTDWSTQFAYSVSNHFSISFAAAIDQSRIVCIRRSVQQKSNRKIYVNKGRSETGEICDCTKFTIPCRNVPAHRILGHRMQLKKVRSNNQNTGDFWSNTRTIFQKSDCRWAGPGAGHRHILISFRCNRLDKNM